MSFYGSKYKTFGKLTADSGQLLSESADKKEHPGKGPLNPGAEAIRRMTINGDGK